MGNFSEVKCVKMLRSKQTKILSAEKTILVAVKTLKRMYEHGYDIDKEWRREAKAHKELNGTRDHIIQGIAAYRQIADKREDDAYHLVLEWADGGSLLSFWKQNLWPQLDGDVERSRKRIMLVLKQLYGLIDALDGMHTTSPKSTEDNQGNHTGSPGPSLQRDVPRVADGVTLPSLAPDSLSMPVFSFEGPNDPQEDQFGATTPPIYSPGPDRRDLSDAERLIRFSSHSSSENWRHGDIKPENILRFTGYEQDPWIGLLKLADLGRAQQHSFKTKWRDTKEKEPWRTRWYEPPDLSGEAHELAEGKISRLFDIWSMGCVMFEMALWLLYGFSSIQALERVVEQNEQLATPYWWKIGHGKYEVTKIASHWINHVLTYDPERDGAVGDLVKLVRDRLLKVDLPPDSDRYSEGFRTNASDLKDQLAQIIDRAKDEEKYLFSGHDRSNVISPQMEELSTSQTSQPESRPFLSPKDARNRVFRGMATTIAQRRIYTNTIENQWKASDDDEFVERQIIHLQLPLSKPYLCQDCDKINVLSPQISFAFGNLKRNTEDHKCDMCKLVYGVVKGMEIDTSDGIMLTRVADGFVLRETKEMKENKILRLCRTDAKANTMRRDISLGAPTLVSVTHSDPTAELLGEFVRLPKAWLQECNRKHVKICAPKHGVRQLPKRLINVEMPGKPKIIDSVELKINPQTVEYIAFSHRWGNIPSEAVTTKHNLSQRKERIPLEDLPLSFRNVIEITRALAHKYLWADSLCIIQGPDGDFAEQADMMQTIFSGAYCIIAACSAENATDGFLQCRAPGWLKLGEAFVSTVTNDFERDVLQSTLHCRGWVLQERALARRTTFFTKNQIYWECGDGIRCETLAKLKNDETAFLGDPRFPDYTIRTNGTIGDQIHLFTKLFQQYSKLELSHLEDRPIAIDGLMDRLTSAFRTQSLAGLFKTFWGRCLLWQRAEGTTRLTKIPLGSHTKKTPPSWSWMAFTGEISFLEPMGGEVSWNEKGVELPFARRNQTSWLKTSHLRDSNAIRTQAFEFANIEKSMIGEAYLSYDGGKALPSTATKCVIIGSEKQQVQNPHMRKHYILLVSSGAQTDRAISHERVGAGYLLGKFIKLANPVSISIE